MTAALKFGPLNLLGTSADLTANGYMYSALADETRFGNPVPIEQKVISWLQDGSLVSKTGDDNRDDMTVRIRITGTSSNKLALAEQALMLQTGIQNTLTWTPPDGLGQPCVFDVVMSNLEHSMDDMGEVRRTQRVYTLRLQCAPFVRSQSPVTVTVPAPSGVQALTTVDACTSFTNWAGTAPNGTGTVSTGVSGATAVFVTNTNNAAISYNSQWALRLARTSLSAAITTTPYIRVDLSLALTNVFRFGNQAPVFVLTGNSGTATVPIAIASSNIYWLDTTGLGLGTTLTGIQVTFSGLYAGGATSVATLSIADISRSNVIGEPATNRQLARVIPVAGSARTQGSLNLADTTNALGSALVYTCPLFGGMAQPNMRQFLTTGPAPVVDGTTVSGATTSLSGTTHVFTIPVTAIQPGAHGMYVRVKHASSGTYNVDWIASTRMGSTNLSSVSGSTAVTVAAGVYQIFEVAELDLPSRLSGSAGSVRISMDSASALTLDEAWLFNKDTGNLTWVECGTAAPAAGGTSNRLWMDAATVDVPQPTVWTGFASDRSDQVFPTTMLSNDVHNIAPTAINVFTVTTNSTAASLSLTHYARWHTHVAA